MTRKNQKKLMKRKLNQSLQKKQLQLKRRKSQSLMMKRFQLTIKKLSLKTKRLQPKKSPNKRLKSRKNE